MFENCGLDIDPTYVLAVVALVGWFTVPVITQKVQIRKERRDIVIELIATRNALNGPNSNLTTESEITQFVQAWNKIPVYFSKNRKIMEYYNYFLMTKEFEPDLKLPEHERDAKLHKMLEAMCREVGFSSFRSKHISTAMNIKRKRNHV